ncbi:MULTISPECIES: matrixin family metalloprotease [unclassified Streptomyces]|uniref:matrixin family metalloprotease n=1 Tax=unclassified Streptomyces TaxID=2593676 RepID=UPI002E154D8E|nr:matrixin family metalloprotease [Streptomyces sp. NBC_01207]WTA16616.1 matrixin family metalloprotease [Streptomyces sp. NBC_00853]
MKRPLAGTSVAAALFLTAPPPAAAVVAAPCVRGESESRSRSSVDDGEIRWTANTAYADAYKHALKAWQHSGHKIKLAPDSATTVNDLEFVDYDAPKDRAAAKWNYRGGPGQSDFIRFNTAAMKNASPTKRRQIAAHELGHALGLCHKSDAGGPGYVRSLMWPTAHEYFDLPQEVDRANYSKLWG